MHISLSRGGKLPQKLKRFEIESVKQKLYEKFKIYGVTNRCDFKTSRCWHVLFNRTNFYRIQFDNEKETTNSINEIKVGYFP
jgi:hypothetical protein